MFRIQYNGDDLSWLMQEQYVDRSAAELMADQFNRRLPPDVAYRTLHEIKADDFFALEEREGEIEQPRYEVVETDDYGNIIERKKEARTMEYSKNIRP